MSASKLSKELLKEFIPLDSLSADSLEKLLKNAKVGSLEAGKILCKRGQHDDTAVFLLSGEVRLVQVDKEVNAVKAGTGPGRHTIASQQPRRSTVVAASDIEYFTVDNELLDILLTWEQSAGYVVEEISPDAQFCDDGDWMTRMLRSNIFLRVPAANIQAIFSRMQSVHVSAGEDVIVQGEPGDFFYIIKSGRAEVLRTAGGRESRLSERGVGDGFGEEALMSDSPRNATVRMSSDGELMRLAKEDFEELLKAPLLEQVDQAQAQAWVDAGEAVWVDVRLENEHEHEALPGSINLPLYSLRLKARHLPDDKALIVYCDTGRRSSAAAFLLSDRGYDVYVLSGGWQGEAVAEVA